MDSWATQPLAKILRAGILSWRPGVPLRVPAAASHLRERVGDAEVVVPEESNTYYIYIYIYITWPGVAEPSQAEPISSAARQFRISSFTVSFHNFKSRNFKLSVSNPKSKYVAYLSVLSQISNCQGLGRKNKHEILKTDRMLSNLVLVSSLRLSNMFPDFIVHATVSNSVSEFSVYAKLCHAPGQYYYYYY